MTTTRKQRAHAATHHKSTVEDIRPHSVPTIEPLEGVTDEREQAFAEGARDEIAPDLRHRMISEAAYHLYEGRGYSEGYELDDWLQAEAAVDHVLIARKPAEEGATEADTEARDESDLPPR